MCVSPDGTKLLTGCIDGKARLWDLRTGKAIGPVLFHKGSVSALRFSADGRKFVVAGTEGIARIYDASTSEALGMLAGHKGFIYDMAFRGDSMVIATAGLDGTARLWDADAAQPIGPPLLHAKDRVDKVQFSKNGDLMTLTRYGKVRIWRLGAFTEGKIQLAEAYRAITGMSLDESGNFEHLDRSTWRSCQGLAGGR